MSSLVRRIQIRNWKKQNKAPNDYKPVRKDCQWPLQKKEFVS